MFPPRPVYALFLECMTVSSEDPEQLCAQRAEAVLRAMRYHTGHTLDDFPLEAATHPEKIAKLPGT